MLASWDYWHQKHPVWRWPLIPRGDQQRIPHNKIDFQFDFFDLAPNSSEIVCLQACDCFTSHYVTDRHEKHLLPPHMSLYFGYQIRVLPPPSKKRDMLNFSWHKDKDHLTIPFIHNVP